MLFAAAPFYAGCMYDQMPCSGASEGFLDVLLPNTGDDVLDAALLDGLPAFPQALPADLQVGEAS